MRKIVKTKLNGRNIVKGINTWAIPVLRYSAPFFSWTKTELQSIDGKTRKLLTTHNGLHPRSDVDRLYISRKVGGRGLAIATVKDMKKNIQDERINKWNEKRMYGQFLRDTSAKVDRVKSEMAEKRRFENPN